MAFAKLITGVALALGVSAMTAGTAHAGLKQWSNDFEGSGNVGWWFDGVELNSYSDAPDDWSAIASIVRTPNPSAVIAFSYGSNEQANIKKSVDDLTGGDTWSKQNLSRLIPKNLPAQNGILWHGKIYCGNIYHGQGDSNQFTDQQLIDWIKTCNTQGGVCTLDYPIDPKTGLLKDFGLTQLKRIAEAVKTGN